MCEKTIEILNEIIEFAADIISGIICEACYQKQPITVQSDKNGLL